MLPHYYESKVHEGPIKLLVVLTQVAADDLKAGQWLVSEENEFLLDFLEGVPYKWAVTALELQDPDLKLGAKQIRERQEHLWHRVAQLGPSVILTLGKPATESMWPAEMGKCPSLAKARTLVTELAPGRTLCCSYDPRQHAIFLRTDGGNGTDLTDEYIRAFTMCTQVIEGTYQKPDMTYTVINSPEGVTWLERRLLELGVNCLSIDTEDRTWWLNNQQVRPHEWPEDTPEKINIYGADNDIYSLQMAFETRDLNGNIRIETYVIDECVLDEMTCIRLLRGRMLIAWNIDTEANSLGHFCSYNIYDPENDHHIIDLMFRAGLPDQSKIGIGLKPTITKHLSAPAWDIKLKQELAEAKKRRVKAGGAPVSSIDEVPKAVAYEYGAFDAYWPLRAYREYYLPGMDGGLPPDCRAFGFLHRALPFFYAMEREGLLIDQEWLNNQLDRLEGELEELETLVATLPEVQQVVVLWNQEKNNDHTQFNVRSPFCFEELAKVTHGIQQPDGSVTFPDYLPRTPKSGDLCRGKEQIAILAGDDPETFQIKIPLEEKTRGQWIWHQFLKIKEHLDYLTKFYTILNYTSSEDSRIHASFRLVKADVAAEDATDATDKGGGTVSGRTATTPNIQNTMDDPNILGCYIAPPGFYIVELDFGRAELVWLGFNTKDHLFRQWALEGKDQHAEKGATLWAIRYNRQVSEFMEQPEEVVKRWRASGKTQNFAEVYLQEPETTARIMGITVEEAMEAAALSIQAHPAVLQAKMDLYDQCQNGELIRTSLLGRARSAEGWRRRSQTAEEFFSLDEEQRNRRDQKNLAIFRSLWNTKGAQADANDTTEYQGVLIYERLQKRDWLNPEWVRPCNFVHDSLRFYVREEYVDTAVPELAKMMEDLSGLPETPLGKFDLPLLVDVKMGPRGNQMEKYDWRGKV